MDSSHKNSNTINNYNKNNNTCGKTCNNTLTGSPGFQPSVWGPGLWLALHIITLNYPEHPTQEQRLQYFEFFRTLGHVLPCHFCQIHFKEYFEQTLGSNKKVSQVFKDRDSLSKWLYDIHENVNIRLHKRKHVTYDDSTKMYNLFRSDKPKYVANITMVPCKKQ